VRAHAPGDHCAACFRGIRLEQPPRCNTPPQVETSRGVQIPRHRHVEAPRTSGNRGIAGLSSCFESRRENKLRTNVSGGGLRCRCRGLRWRHDRRVNGRVDRPISGLCEGAGDGVEEVGLDILRHGRGGMTEYPLDDLHVRAGADGEAGCGVAHGLRVRHPPSRRDTSRCLLRPGLTRSCVVPSRTRHSALNQTP
jgi:hypothetical protein